MISYLKKILKYFYDQSNPYESVLLYPLELKIDIINKSYPCNRDRPKYSIITPVLNEEVGILDTLKSIESQTQQPDEVIIVDGGSTDNTMVKIEQYMRYSNLNIKLLTSTIKRNIGAQRNMAIISARNELLLNVDVGTILDRNYAADMIGPVVEYDDVDLVGGVVYAKKRHIWSFMFSKKQHFVKRVEPYGACVLYKKSIALKIGGYPEYLTYAGEDTFFSYKYKKLSKYWILNRKPFILWEHPSTLFSMIKKKLSYGRANFEIGLWPYFYYKKLQFLPIKLIVKYTPIKLIYKQFLKAQTSIEINRRNIKGICFIFAKEGINEESSIELKNYTIESISNNHKVFFINNHNILSKEFIDLDHSLLELVDYDNFSFKEIEYRYGAFLEKAIFIIDTENAPLMEINLLKKRYSNIEIIDMSDDVEV